MVTELKLTKTLKEKFHKNMKKISFFIITLFIFSIIFSINNYKIFGLTDEEFNINFSKKDYIDFILILFIFNEEYKNECYFYVDTNFYGYLKKHGFLSSFENISKEDFFIKFIEKIRKDKELITLSNLITSSFIDIFFYIKNKYSQEIVLLLKNYKFLNLINLFEVSYFNYNYFKNDEILKTQNKKFKTKINEINLINLFFIPFYKVNNSFPNSNIVEAIPNFEKNKILYITSYKNSQKDILYESYVENIDNKLKEIGVFPKLINITKQQREKFLEIFKREFSYPEFEYFTRKLFINYVLLNIGEDELKNYISLRYFYIKYTNLNNIFLRWDALSSDFSSIPFPRTFGNEVLKILDDDIPQKNLDIKKLFLNEKNLVFVLIPPLNYFNNKQGLKTISKLKKYIKFKYKAISYDYKYFLNNIEKFDNSKIIFVYFGNGKNNILLNIYFNILNDNMGNIFYNNYKIEKSSSLVTVNFENYLNVLLLTNEDDSIFIRMINRLKELYNGDFLIKKRNPLQIIFDKIIYLFF